MSYESQTTYKKYEDMSREEVRAIVVDVLDMASRTETNAISFWGSVQRVKIPLQVFTMVFRSPKRGEKYVHRGDSSLVKAQSDHCSTEPQWVVVG